MSWGFTVSTSVSAHATASGLDTLVVTPWRSASSWARSSRRAVTMSSSGLRAPLRISPDTSASPIFPPPRKATFLPSLTSSEPPAGPRTTLRRPRAPCGTSPPAPEPQDLRHEEPHVGRTLGHPACEVRVPLVAVRHVDANGVAVPGQRGLQVAADPVEELELHPPPVHAVALDVPARPLGHPWIVAGHVDRVPPRHQSGEQPGEAPIDVGPVRKRHVAGFEVCTLHQ